MSERTHPYGLEYVATNGELEHLLGYRGYFQDVASGSGTGAVTENSGQVIEAIWVKNTRGSALSPGYGLIWNTSEDIGKDVTIAGNNAMWAGVVSHRIVGTVADDENFWMIVKGPSKVVHDGNDTVVKGSLLVAATGGKVDLYDASPTSDALAQREATLIVGRASAAPADNADGTLINTIVDLRGI